MERAFFYFEMVKMPYNCPKRITKTWASHPKTEQTAGLGGPVTDGAVQ